MKELKLKLYEIKQREPFSLYCVAIDIALLVFVAIGMLPADIHDVVILLVIQLALIFSEKFNRLQDRIDDLEAYRQQIEMAKLDIRNSVSAIKIHEVK